jgi:fructuronate reductase
VGLVSRLSPETLQALPPSVRQPRYDRTALQTGIVHLGVGAFMRAHLAVATEAAIEAGDLCWGLCGVSLRSTDTQSALGPQQGLYTVAVRDADTTGQPRQGLQVIGCLRELLVAPQQPATVIERIAAPTTRIVSLTVTEKGYCRAGSSDGLQLDHPDIVADLSDPALPRSALGWLVRGLHARRASGLGGLTLMSLDNLPANGDTLRRLSLELAARSDAGLVPWIEAECSFPNSMVDRIVPRTTDADRVAVAEQLGRSDAWPVIAEPFFDWAVEDRFVHGRPDWTAMTGPNHTSGGPRFVADAAPWETLKLRMVNGAHSAIAYLGVMAGWQTVDEAMHRPELRRFIDDLLREEVAPTLHGVDEIDLTTYRLRLQQRFANPALAHRTQQIAMDGSQKIPQRWMGTLRERLDAGQPAPRLALALAAWLHFLRGHDEAGQTYEIADPLAVPLQALVRDAGRHRDITDEVRALLAFAPVFGDLAADAQLVGAVAEALRALRERGVGATVSAWPTQDSPCA